MDADWDEVRSCPWFLVGPPWRRVMPDVQVDWHEALLQLGTSDTQHANHLV